MRVLVTSASRKVGLVRAFRDALSAEGGGAVLAADASPLSAALYVADGHVLLPRSTHPEFLDFLVDYCRREAVRLVVPTRDEELPIFAAHRERFTEVGTVMLVPSPEVVRVCQDKAAFLDACEAAGLATPRRVDFSIPGLRFPLFVKPRFGKGSRLTFRADDARDLDLALGKVPDPIVQELVEAPEFTIDLFADLDGRVLSVVPRERMLVLGGESFISRTVKSVPLIEAAIRLARELGLTGHNTIQCFLDGARIPFIEVNPRFGGAAALSFAAGAPSPRFLVRLLQGKTVARAVDDFRDGLVMLRYTEDLFLEPGRLGTRSVP